MSRTKTDKPPSQPASDAGRVATLFVVKLVVLTLLLGFAEAYLMELSRRGAEPDWMFGLRKLVTTMGAGLARAFDSRVEHDVVSISGQRMQLIVSVECTALFAKALFCAAAIAFPTRWRDRLIGCVVGLIGVLLLNVLRVGGLVLISNQVPSFFHFAHLVLMQWFLISCVAPMWLLWAVWATKRSRKASG